MDSAIREHTFSVPDRGVRERCLGFSTWLEYVLAGGLSLLFLVGVLVDSYHEGVFARQLQAAGAALLAAAAGTILWLDRAGSRRRLAARIALGCAAAAAFAGAAFLMWQAFAMVGLPSRVVRLIVCVAFGLLVFWAWGCVLWLHGVVRMRRVLPGPGGGAGDRERKAGRAALARLWAMLRGLRGDSWSATVLNVAGLLPDAFTNGVARDLLLAALDPALFYPSAAKWDRELRLLSFAGHRLVDWDHPIPGDEYDHRRYAGMKSSVAVAALALVFLGMVQLPSCRHETPKGILGGMGNRIAKGRVPVQRKRAPAEVKKQVTTKPKSEEKIVRESVLQLFRQTMDDQSLQLSVSSITEDVGLPDGQGQGQTAAGSPKGTKIGGKYYFYRLKYGGGNWDANRKGIPTLMQEFTKAVNVKTNAWDQEVTFSDLPRHKDEFFPVLLYITGNGRIDASNEEVENLRNYLMEGGFLFADSSGGDFYTHFVALMKRVLPDKNPLPVAYDHTIFRGQFMPWQMESGCPVYRRHEGAGRALGWMMTDRLAVFYSGGDLGAAWATVGWARNSQRDVQLAFRMGTNIICYAMLYGGPKGLEDKEE